MNLTSNDRQVLRLRQTLNSDCQKVWVIIKCFPKCFTSELVNIPVCPNETTMKKFRLTASGPKDEMSRQIDCEL